MPPLGGRRGLTALDQLLEDDLQPDRFSRLGVVSGVQTGEVTIMGGDVGGDGFVEGPLDQVTPSVQGGEVEQAAFERGDRPLLFFGRLLELVDLVGPGVEGVVPAQDGLVERGPCLLEGFGGGFDGPVRLQQGPLCAADLGGLGIDGVEAGVHLAGLGLGLLGRRAHRAHPPSSRLEVELGRHGGQVGAVRGSGQTRRSGCPGQVTQILAHVLEVVLNRRLGPLGGGRGFVLASLAAVQGGLGSGDGGGHGVDPTPQIVELLAFAIGGLGQQRLDFQFEAVAGGFDRLLGGFGAVQGGGGLGGPGPGFGLGSTVSADLLETSEHVVAAAAQLTLGVALVDGAQGGEGFRGTGQVFDVAAVLLKILQGLGGVVEGGVGQLGQGPVEVFG